MSAQIHTTKRGLTADDLLSMPDDGMRRELVRGELRETTPAGREHGRIAMEIGSHMHVHVTAHGLGEAFAADTGFRLATNTVRAGDVVPGWSLPVAPLFR